MKFNKHFRLVDKHSFLSPSSYHWLNYTPDRLEQVYINRVIASAKGTRLHAYASEAIKLKQRQWRCKKTLSMFINDAISYDMDSEVPLYYSENCFGTTDAISFENGLLRIHDLKTGSIPASMTQLKVYAALFCLEYDVNPNDIKIELRIYQNDAIVVDRPPSEEIDDIINKIISNDILIENIKKREGLINE